MFKKKKEENLGIKKDLTTNITYHQILIIY